jgi:hypothetical protein
MRAAPYVAVRGTIATLATMADSRGRAAEAGIRSPDEVCGDVVGAGALASASIDARVRAILCEQTASSTRFGTGRRRRQLVRLLAIQAEVADTNAPA